MFTLHEMIVMALLTALVFVIIAVWLTFALCNNHLWRVRDELTARIEILEREVSIELVTVTLHDAVTDDFVETVRFGSDLYRALSYIETKASQYNLYLKVRRTNGEYVALNLINS